MLLPMILVVITSVAHAGGGAGENTCRNFESELRANQTCSVTAPKNLSHCIWYNPEYQAPQLVLQRRVALVLQVHALDSH